MLCVLEARYAPRVSDRQGSTGHDLCWHHPQLWGLLPEPIPQDLAVSDWPQFLRGCIRYRQALDRELPDAPRTQREYDEGSHST